MKKIETKKKQLNKKFLFMVLIFYLKLSFSQTNLIPNGDFEKSINPITCSPGAGCNVTQDDFNALIYNWEAAIHNNDASNKNDVGNIYYIDASNTTCQGIISSSSYCSVLIPSPVSSFTGTKFVRIRADVDKCKKTKYKHGAIGVALENGQTFDKDKTYIIRYKIVPLRSRNCDKNDQDICTGTQLISHIRFFLSELGPKHWDKNNSDKQELINVNFTKNLSSSVSTCYDPSTGTVQCHQCIFSQQIRSFKPDKNIYTTLVLYAESGGAFIDDVEVFEECLSPYLIQNKIYDYPLYAPFAINGSHMSEQSGGTLKAGNNIDASRPTGDVTIYPNTKVIYTAADEIELMDGFNVYEGSEFSAVIEPCPNSFSMRLLNNDNIEYNNNAELENHEIISTKNMDTIKNNDFNLMPNPSSTHFHISMTEEDFNDLKKIEIVNTLGQVKELPVRESQDISDLAEGVYMVKFYFNTGMLVVKSLIIKR